MKGSNNRTCNCGKKLQTFETGKLCYECLKVKVDKKFKSDKQ